MAKIVNKTKVITEMCIRDSYITGTRCIAVAFSGLFL